MRITIVMLLFFSMFFFTAKGAKIKHITASEFKELIFNYAKEKEWSNKTKKPILIDFYATWCGPCKRVAPVLQELQDELGEKLTIYKVNVDKERELSAVFAVRSMPTFLFIPKEGNPTKALGALSKATFLKAFKDIYGIGK